MKWLSVMNKHHNNCQIYNAFKNCDLRCIYVILDGERQCNTFLYIYDWYRIALIAIFGFRLSRNVNVRPLNI